MSRWGGFLRRVGALSKKEIIHILRDVRVIYLALGLPVVLLTLFGYAVTFDSTGCPSQSSTKTRRRRRAAWWTP